MLNAAVLASSGGSQNSSSNVVKSNRITWSVHLYTLWLYATVGWAAFYWFVSFACMCHSLLTNLLFPRSTGHRPKSQDPFGPDFVVRTDFVVILQEVQPENAALNLRKCYEQPEKASLKYKNQIKQTKRLNHQDTKHEATVDYQTIGGQLQSVIIA